MYKRILLFSMCLLAAAHVQAQTYSYQVDLARVQNDQVSVSLSVPKLSQAEATFYFPATVPGTYATEDYGRFIADFQALDASGKALVVTKTGNNGFRIAGADQAVKITYKVDDTFDAEVKKDPIFEPAGTNIEAGKNFVMNNGGFFGFFEGMEELPYEITVSKPAALHGLSAMETRSEGAEKQVFKAKDYHQLIDCPILFAGTDTASFMVNNTRVQIMVYSETGEKLAGRIYNELKESMVAIAKFLPELPVDRYAFLFYIKDYRETGKTLLDPNFGLGDILKLVSEFRGKGFGALEHGNSSVYYLPDFGLEMMSIESQIKDVAIHEFMHIVTPLGLHSQHIGDFNYVNPVMSRHLWLYEGITEYFAGLIQVQGGLMTETAYFTDVIQSKIKSGSSYPAQKMSFAEMSANVLEKKYEKQYNHVYDRGAVLGLLLDIEIIRLTDGKKTLKDVVLTLRSRYGADKSFDENSFIKEFVAEVHPDLQQWFDTYIEGRNDWDLSKGLAPVGVSYAASAEVSMPRNPLKDNDVQMSLMNLYVKSTGKEEWAGLKPGDRMLPGSSYEKTFRDENGNYLKEGETAKMKVIRKDKTISLPIKVEYKSTKVNHYVEWLANPDAGQSRMRAIWLAKQP
ncbi:MAG: hypothetical protein EAZ89_19665 [Bacteroidetes bacterium]|nr:MAG: hypothetical protein EAZ89_19665 [Bacteroidota bacterium]